MGPEDGSPQRLLEGGRGSRWRAAEGQSQSPPRGTEGAEGGRGEGAGSWGRWGRSGSAGGAWERDSGSCCGSVASGDRGRCRGRGAVGDRRLPPPAWVTMARGRVAPVVAALTPVHFSKFRGETG